MLCLSTLSLGFLLSALFITQLINGDTAHAQMTFLLGVLALLLQNLGCILGGEFGGWMTFGILVSLTVLITLVQTDTLESTPSILPNKCKPVRSGSGSGSNSGSGTGNGRSGSSGGAGTGADAGTICLSSLPLCPHCPGVDACPPPQYLCGI